jgi:ParB/RepB/Spo0J family partition protein
MNDELKTIPLTDLHPPRMPLRPVRKKSVEFAELTESIRTDGILQSLLVRPHATLPGYEIVEGEHRREAALLAGLEVAPCIVREMTDQEALIIQLKANAVRPEETRKYEYARRLKKLLDDGLTLAELSAMIDKSPQWIKQILRLTNLCSEAIVPVNHGDIPLNSAIALAQLPIEEQPKYVQDAIIMKAKNFVQRAREIRTDYEAYLLKLKQEDQNSGIEPKLRTVKELIAEFETWDRAEQVLEAYRAKTPLDGWKACLAWMFKLDPLTIEMRRNKVRQSTCANFKTEIEKQQFKRKLVEKLVLDFPEWRKLK